MRYLKVPPDLRARILGRRRDHQRPPAIDFPPPHVIGPPGHGWVLDFWDNGQRIWTDEALAAQDQRLSARYDFVPPRFDLPCFVWSGSLDGGRYGRYGTARNHGFTSSSLVHRIAWQLLHGDVLPGWEVDHLCRVRACFEPSHLEAKPQAANRQGRRHQPRGGMCPAGHVYAEVGVTSQNRCKECHRRDMAAWHDRNRAYANRERARDTASRRRLPAATEPPSGPTRVTTRVLTVGGQPCSPPLRLTTRGPGPVGRNRMPSRSARARAGGRLRT